MTPARWREFTTREMAFNLPNVHLMLTKKTLEYTWYIMLRSSLGSSINGWFILWLSNIAMEHTVDGRCEIHQLKTVVNIHPTYVVGLSTIDGAGFRWPTERISGRKTSGLWNPRKGASIGDISQICKKQNMAVEWSISKVVHKTWSPFAD